MYPTAAAAVAATSAPSRSVSVLGRVVLAGKRMIRLKCISLSREAICESCYKSLKNLFVLRVSSCLAAACLSSYCCCCCGLEKWNFKIVYTIALEFCT